MLIFILVRSYLSPIISTASSSGCVSLSFFVAPHPFSPLYTPLFSFPLCLFCIEMAPFSSSISLALSLSLPPTLSLILVSRSPSAPFSIHPLWSLILQTSFSRCLFPFYAAFSPPPRNSMCSSSICSAPGRCQTSVNGFQLCPPLAVQLLSFPLVSASMAAATHSKP